MSPHRLRSGGQNMTYLPTMRSSPMKKRFVIYHHRTKYHHG